MTIATQRLWVRRTVLVGTACLALTPVLASETITYAYDSRGRLVKVVHTGTVNNGTSSCYTYDRADNRSNVTVATSADCATVGITLTVNPANLSSGTVGSAYSQTITASGGTGPYTFSTTAGTLPTGLGLNSSTGILSGTPTAAATSNFTITAADSASHTGSRAYTVTVANGVTLTLSPTTLLNGTVGTAYSQTIVASGGTSPYTYATTAGTLPTGLSLNNSTGILSGTPTTAATYNFTITANDSASHAGNRAYTVTPSAGGACSGVSFRVNDVAVSEGDPLVFTVTKTGSTSVSCNVNYATANNTAVAPGDYAAGSGTLTFTNTQTTRTVSITTVLAGPNESTETMYLNLSAATGGAAISDSQGVGTLYNDPGDGGCPLC